MCAIAVTRLKCRSMFFMTCISELVNQYINFYIHRCAQEMLNILHDLHMGTVKLIYALKKLLAYPSCLFFIGI